MVGFEAGAPALVEPKDEIPPLPSWMSNRDPSLGPRQRMVGSLTGAVASQRVTEARDGGLKLVGNQLSSAMA